MNKITVYLLTMLLGLSAGQPCFAQWKKTVTPDNLTKGDIRKAILAGEITGSCKMADVKGHDALSLNPSTVIIKRISQKDGTARIHFMGRLKKNIRSDQMVMGCEADLVRLDSGEWMDPENGKKFKK